MTPVDERAGRVVSPPGTYVPTLHGEQINEDGYLHDGTGSRPALDQAEGTTAASDQAQARRELLAQASDGSLTLDDLFQAADQEDSGDHRIAGHIHLRAALLALPGIGDAKADAILEEVGVDGEKHLAAVGARQRKQLADAVQEHQ
jgi:hypothetical protein